MPDSDVSNNPRHVAVGVFAGPVCGLRYRSLTCSGVTNERGEFEYRAREAVTFSIGGIVLGTAAGAPQISLAQLANRTDGRIDKLNDPFVTNLARLVQTLDRDGNVETGLSIAPAVHDLVGTVPMNFAQSEIEFESAASNLRSAKCEEREDPPPATRPHRWILSKIEGRIERATADHTKRVFDDDEAVG